MRRGLVQASSSFTPTRSACSAKKIVQGCPLTPLLFNLFINDLFSDSAGVRVPGLPNGRVADLKYADDVVALARSRNRLRRQLRRVSRWGEANGMRVGARKCGIMVVGESI